VDTERLERGLAGLATLGFEPVPARNLRRREGLFAGDDRERLAAFHDLAADPGLKAIFFVRGGHGLLRLLPGVDWDLLARHPRAYVGYSDLTPFLLGVVHRLGWIAFHGPMVAVELAAGLEEAEAASLGAALAGELEGEIPLTGCEGEEAVEGVLLGGCLSLLTATLGTPWAAALAGGVVFWEDAGEALYRLDRMLTHLRLSGTLAGIRGMVAGRPDAGEDAAAFPGLLREVARSEGVTVGWGLPAGHGRPNLTLPLGARVRLDPATTGLRLLPL
jgi:muramoyltetrapeptide carboxypeptidase